MDTFGSCIKRSRLPSLDALSVRNLSKRSQSWPLSQPCTPEKKNLPLIGAASPLHLRCLKETAADSPLLTSTPWSFRNLSLDSLIERSGSQSFMYDEWLTPIQTKEINISGLTKPEIDPLYFEDIAKNLFYEPEQLNNENSKEKCKTTIESVTSSYSSGVDDSTAPQSQELSSSVMLVRSSSSFEQSSLVDSGYISSSMDSTFLIGKKMGLRHCDILSELLNVEPNIVDQIVSYLSPDDLQSVSCVCSSWKEFCDESKLVQDMKKKSTVSQKNKENHMKTAVVKETTSMNCPLKEVQRKNSHRECIAQSPVKISLNNQLSTRRHNMFREAASDLLVDESLSKCPRCCSPAKLSMNRQRGNCKRRSCMFDFCVSCHTNFHRGTPCKVSPRRISKKGNVVGSKSSKGNLRRL
ncbi:F-box only protein 5-like [Anneissia japonica]|uniref:F-box only protein 5-like n=1 Tax=Anneissia japonica TaxID=1529436 RepID=UPI0014254DB8|nr:F-box only protein 5-like [Anneissia japonica]